MKQGDVLERQGGAGVLNVRLEMVQAVDVGDALDFAEAVEDLTALASHAKHALAAGQQPLVGEEAQETLGKFSLGRQEILRRRENGIVPALEDAESVIVRLGVLAALTASGEQQFTPPAGGVIRIDNHPLAELGDVSLREVGAQVHRRQVG
jgi:hypothetical protein